MKHRSRRFGKVPEQEIYLNVVSEPLLTLAIIKAFYTSRQASDREMDHRLEYLFWRIWSSRDLLNHINIKYLDGLVSRIMTSEPLTSSAWTRHEQVSASQPPSIYVRLFPSYRTRLPLANSRPAFHSQPLAQQPLSLLHPSLNPSPCLRARIPGLSMRPRGLQLYTRSSKSPILPMMSRRKRLASSSSSPMVEVVPAAHPIHPLQMW